MFWNEKLGEWSQDGLQKLSFSGFTTTCCSNHLTYFAIATVRRLKLLCAGVVFVSFFLSGCQCNAAITLCLRNSLKAKFAISALQTDSMLQKETSVCGRCFWARVELISCLGGINPVHVNSLLSIFRENKKNRYQHLLLAVRCTVHVHVNSQEASAFWAELTSRFFVERGRTFLLHVLFCPLK